MTILKINLENFRNFNKKEINFSDVTTVIVGSNAAGKTNILEALSLLSTGKSFRAGIEGEMISYESDLARISGQFSSVQNVESSMDKKHATGYLLPATKLEVVLTRGVLKIGDDKIEKVQKKKLIVNGVAKRLIDFAGNFKTVLFGPWDIDLVSGSPSLRRNFLDSVLFQIDREYRRSVLSYEKGLRQRNRILWDLRENPFITSGRERLHFWDKLIIKNGDYVGQQREKFINFANTGNLQYPNSNFQIEYDKSAISQARLEEYEKEEVAAAMTLVGPHRDDFKFQITNSKLQTRRDLATYGSRGEQRMGILWLKMCELAYIEDKTGDKPVLLLDDIFSELDHEHRQIVMDLLHNQQTPLHPLGFGGQAIITTADEHFVEDLPESSIIKLS